MSTLCLPGVFEFVDHEKTMREVYHIIDQIHLTRSRAVRTQKIQTLCFRRNAHLGFHHRCLRFSRMGFLMGEQGSIYVCEKNTHCHRIVVSMSGRVRTGETPFSR